MNMYLHCLIEADREPTNEACIDGLGIMHAHTLAMFTPTYILSCLC